MADRPPEPSAWLSEDEVRELSRSLGESAESAQRRVESARSFAHLPLEPNPLYRKYGYFAGVDLTGLRPTARGPPVRSPRPIAGGIQVIHDASGTRVTIPPELEALGVSARAQPDEATDASKGGASLGAPATPSDRLSALALATWNRSFVLEVPAGVTEPIRVQELTILSEPHQAVSIRRSIRAGRGAQLLLTEELYCASDGRDQRFFASSTDLTVGEDAKVVSFGLHAPDARVVSYYQRRATTGPNARLAWLWVGLSGFRSKVRNHTELTGVGSIVDDLQAFYGREQTAYDSEVNLTHIATDTRGQSITRGVYADEARGMSRGLVRIEREARKTVSFISEHAMLLNRGARSDTIPILEILCRDVKATHSSSVAPVDPEKVFYLESRGHSQPDAVRMISEGFLAYVLERAPIHGLRDLLYPQLEARWAGRELRWDDDRRPLPPLEVTGTESAPEWRFDSKLR